MKNSVLIMMTLILLSSTASGKDWNAGMDALKTQWVSLWGRLNEKSIDGYLQKLQKDEKFQSLNESQQKAALKDIKVLLQEHLGWDVMGEQISNKLIVGCGAWILDQMMDKAVSDLESPGQSVAYDDKCLDKAYKACQKQAFISLRPHVLQAFEKAFPDVLKRLENTKN